MKYECRDVCNKPNSEKELTGGRVASKMLHFYILLTSSLPQILCVHFKVSSDTFVESEAPLKINPLRIKNGSHTQQLLAIDNKTNLENKCKNEQG